MKILEKKKVSFGIRLKELMQEHDPPLTQEGLAGLLRNPAYEDNPPFNPHTISNWMHGGSLRRNRGEILQQLADIFDVDPAYLECKQVEKHKIQENFPSANSELINDVKRIDGFTSYLESIGIKCDYATRGRTEINEYIDSGYLYKVEESIGEETEIILTFNDKTITLSESECNKKIQDLEKYVKFYLFN